MSRELPYNTEMKQSILGVMMIYSSVISVVYNQGLDVRDFYLGIHQRILFTIMDITDSGRPVNVITLIARLQDVEQLNLVGGADYTVELSDTAISSANSVCYIETIKSRARLRRLIEAVEQIAEDDSDAANGLDEIMDKAERDIPGVMRSRRATDFKSSWEVASNVMQELIRLRSSDNRVTGTKTGYTDPDRMANGFQRGDLIILAVRPATGKTAFALNLALNASFYNPGTVAILSLEMSTEVLMKHILSAKSAVESNKPRSGAILDDEFNKPNEAANKLMASELFVGDSSNIEISEVFSRCRKLRGEHGPDLVVIDYLQLIGGGGKSEDNRQQGISEISRSLKELTREMECPVIALPQLPRSVETRPDKHPMLSDFRESEATEQDVDIVMFLYRDAYYAKDSEAEQSNPTDQTDLDTAKHRNGATGKVELTLQKSMSTFFNIAYDGFSQCQIVVI